MKKYLLNISYIIRHKWYVGVECFKRGLCWQGLVHDLSKLTPIEFGSYAEFFYGDHGMDRGSWDDRPEPVQYAFEMGWLHHLHRNKHHWQYWIRHNDDGNVKVFEMPERYAIEMVCDWIGAGKAQGYISPPEDPMQEAREWYKRQRKNMKLHHNTALFVEKMLGLVRRQLSDNWDEDYRYEVTAYDKNGKTINGAFSNNLMQVEREEIKW